MNEKRLSVFVWALTLTGVLLYAPTALGRKGNKKTEANEGSEAANLFEKLQVVSLKMRMAPEALAKLQKSYTNQVVFVPADIEENGRVYAKVGVHLRGVSTFQPVNKKPNFTLKFNEFVSGQQFHGLHKLRLSNGMVDRTYLNELLAARLFNAAGVATPRVTFARVELNGRDLGLYVMIEGVTRDFLNRCYGTVKGNVYEGDQTDVDGELEQDYGKRSKHRTDLQDLVDAAKETDLHKRYLRLGQALDLDAFTGYVAVEVLLNLWDSYSMRITNYRVFCNHDTGKVSFIAHGNDRAFDAPTDPVLPEFKGMVTKALLETPEGRERFANRLAELQSKLMVKEDLFKLVDEANAVIQPVLTEIHAEKIQQRASLVLCKRIQRRIEVVDKALPNLLHPEQHQTSATPAKKKPDVQGLASPRAWER